MFYLFSPRCLLHLWSLLTIPHFLENSAFSFYSFIKSIWVATDKTHSKKLSFYLNLFTWCPLLSYHKFLLSRVSPAPGTLQHSFILTLRHKYEDPEVPQLRGLKDKISTCILSAIFSLLIPNLQFPLSLKNGWLGYTKGDSLNDSKRLTIKGNTTLEFQTKENSMEGGVQI